MIQLTIIETEGLIVVRDGDGEVVAEASGVPILRAACRDEVAHLLERAEELREAAKKVERMADLWQGLLVALDEHEAAS